MAVVLVFVFLGVAAFPFFIILFFSVIQGGNPNNLAHDPPHVKAPPPVNKEAVKNELRGKEKALAEINDADSLYRDGKHALAIAKYKHNFSALTLDRHAEVIKRIVDNEAGKTNDKEARRWIELALDSDLAPSYENPVALKLVQQVETERNQKAAIEKMEREAEEARLKTEAEAAAKAKKESRTKALLAELKDSDATVRRDAVLAIGELGDRAKEAIPDLAAAVIDSDKSLRLAALGALRKFGTESKAAVPNLVKALSSKDASTRKGAIEVLTAIGPEAKGAAADLVLIFDEKSLRTVVLQALVGIGKDSVPALVNGLDNKSSFVRRWAARTLGELGSDAKESLPALRTKARSDPSITVREEAQKAIDRIKK